MVWATADREILMIERGRTWKAECASATISGGVDFKLGFVTPNREIVVLSRDYTATVSEVFAALYETTFTGGSVARVLNRRLLYPGPQLMEIREGVTATLGDVVTSATIRAASSAGNANAVLPGDLKALVLKANTSYVVQLLNRSSAIGTIALSFDFRTMEKLTTFDEQI